MAWTVLLRHGLRGLVLTQKPPEGRDEPGDASLSHVDMPGPEHLIDAIDDLREGALRRSLPAAELAVEAGKHHRLATALAQGVVLVDGGGDELHARELHALEVGVVVLVAVHVQVARQEGGHDGALVQVRVLVVDDLAEELPGVAVADRVRAEATQGILEFAVLAQARALPRVLPPVFDGPQGPRDGFAAGIAQVRVGDCFHLHHRVDAGSVQAFGDRDERVRVDFPGHVRVRIVHLEVVLDAGRCVLEVHDHGRGLAGVGAVQARECLDGGDAG